MYPDHRMGLGGTPMPHTYGSGMDFMGASNFNSNQPDVSHYDPTNWRSMFNAPQDYASNLNRYGND